MNKKVVYFLLIFGLLAVAGSSFAQVRLDNPLPGVDNFSTLLSRIAGVVGQILMALGALMIVFSGFLFMTSSGKPEKISTAKTALLYAILGIVIGGLASAIANLIVSAMRVGA